MKKLFLLPLILTRFIQAQQPPENAFTFQQVIPRLESLAASAVNPKDVEEHYRSSQSNWIYPLRNFAEDMKIEEYRDLAKEYNSERLNLLCLRGSSLSDDRKREFVEDLIDEILTYPSRDKDPWERPSYLYIANILARSQGLSNEFLNNCLRIAKKSEYIDIVNLILFYMDKKGERATTFYNQWEIFPLHKSIVDGSINDRIKEGLIIDKKTINQKDNDYETPLHLAVKYSNDSVIQFLLNNGSYTKIKNNFFFHHYGEETPLSLACKWRNKKTVALLLKNGVDKEEPPEIKPLLYACEYNKKEVAQLLIDNGADVKCKDREGYTPLLYACKYSTIGIVELLIQNGADVNSQNFYGTTPLHYACQYNKKEVAQLLIDNGADVNSKDNFKQTPLIRACLSNRKDIVRLLIQNGADLKNNCLNFACKQKNKSVEVIQLLIENGADINAQEENKQTPLHYVCEDGSKNINLIKLLIENGADINCKNWRKETPLELLDKAIRPEIERFVTERRSILNTFCTLL